MLKLKNVSKYYYNKGVIASGFSKVNLELKMGEFVAITGESGSGKSTLLNVISGLDTYEEGEMYINGKETSHYTGKDFEDFRRKYISNIFQSFNLVNSYTVYQNIELVLLLNGNKKRNIKKKIIEIIKQVDLYKFRNTKVSKLSGGQKQRVAIARALAKETPIIIADEPTGNLDTVSAAEIIKLLSKISKDKLVIIVTHNYEQIEKYVTRKIKMHDGRIIEDKIIKEANTKIEVQEAKYKNITFISKFRLGLRNTFNIFPKFALLFLVFAFVTLAIISEYAEFKKQEKLAEESGYNYLFQDARSNRIVINKKDKAQFTDEDYEKIERLSNIKSIEKNDLLLDQSIGLSDNKFFYLYGAVTNNDNFEGNVDIGRLPENDSEVIIETFKDNYEVSEGRADELLKTDLYLSDNFTGQIDTETKVRVVGIKYIEGRMKYQNKIYASKNFIQKLNFQINQRYSTTKILFLDKYYQSDGYSSSFKVTPNSNVPVGSAYVSSDLNYYSSTGSCKNKPIQINIENIYYSETITLNIAKTYTKYNIKSLLGIEDFVLNNGAIFVNPEDYNILFSKPTYQSSIFVENTELLEQTVKELNENEYNTLDIKNTLVDDSLKQVMQIIKTVVTIALIIALFFISYFVIKIILKSRNTYFATIRTLGGTQKNSKQLLIIELLTIENLVYFIFILLIILNSKGIFSISLVNDMMEYLKIMDYTILYIVLTGMSYLISLKYSRKLFKNSTMKTFSEEV